MVATERSSAILKRTVGDEAATTRARDAVADDADADKSLMAME